MSILLDALRKSEKSKHKHSVPTIHTDNQTGAVLSSFRVGPLILVITVALVVNGWFIWRQYRAPDVGYQPPVTLASDRSPVGAGETASSQTDAGEVTKQPAETAVVTKPASQQRTPVESYEGPAQNASRPASVRIEPPVKKTPATAIERSGSKQAGSQASTSRPAAKVKPKKNVPHQPAPISYWELPDAIRADIPEIKFSVLVYANNPDDRFVLINGQRLREGDNLQPGLPVREIRRDGVIFSYRLYRFLVEK